MTDSKKAEGTVISSTEVSAATTVHKKKIIGLVVVVVIILAALFGAKSHLIAATVNGSPIYRWTVISELEAKGGTQVLDGMITKKLIEAEFARTGVSVPKEELDAEIAKLSEQTKAQGMPLETMLAMRGMTMDQLREQIGIQKKVEKILKDKITVSDAEIATYIKDNKVTPPKDLDPQKFLAQIGDQLRQEKIGKAADAWLAGLKSGAHVLYYGAYTAPKSTAGGPPTGS